MPKIRKRVGITNISIKMFSPEIQQLIDAALTDGVITDKEKSIIIKRVEKEGFSVDEAEMLLDAEMQKKSQLVASSSSEANQNVSTISSADKMREMLAGLDLTQNNSNIVSAITAFKTPTEKRDLLDFMDFLKEQFPLAQNYATRMGFFEKYLICLTSANKKYAEDPDFKDILDVSEMLKMWENWLLELVLADDVKHCLNLFPIIDDRNYLLNLGQMLSSLKKHVLSSRIDFDKKHIVPVINDKKGEIESALKSVKHAKLRVQKISSDAQTISSADIMREMLAGMNIKTQYCNDRKDKLSSAITQFKTPTEKKDLLDFIDYLKEQAPLAPNYSLKEGYLYKYMSCLAFASKNYATDPEFKDVLDASEIVKTLENVKQSKIWDEDMKTAIHLIPIMADRNYLLNLDQTLSSSKKLNSIWFRGTIRSKKEEIASALNDLDRKV